MCRRGHRQQVRDHALIEAAELVVLGEAVFFRPVPSEHLVAGLKIPTPLGLLPQTRDALAQLVFDGIISTEVLTDGKHALHEKSRLDDVAAVVLLAGKGDGFAGVAAEVVGPEAVVALGFILEEGDHLEQTLGGLLASDKTTVGADHDSDHAKTGSAGGRDRPPVQESLAGQTTDRMTEIPEVPEASFLHRVQEFLVIHFMSRRTGTFGRGGLGSAHLLVAPGASFRTVLAEVSLVVDPLRNTVVKGSAVGPDEVAVNVNGMRVHVELLPWAVRLLGSVDIEKILIGIGNAIPDQVDAAVVALGDQARGRGIRTRGVSDGQDHNHVWLLLRNCKRRRSKNCTHDDESGNSHFCFLPDVTVLTPLQFLL